MKILKIVLLIIGIGLIVVGLIEAFVPETVFKLGPIQVDEKEGLSSQVIGMIGIGVLAVIGSALIKER